MKDAIILICFQWFLPIKARASPDSDGPPKSNWSVCRPQVVWTLTVGDGLIQPALDLRSGVDGDARAEETLEYELVL